MVRIDARRIVTLVTNAYSFRNWTDAPDECNSMYEEGVFFDRNGSVTMLSSAKRPRYAFFRTSHFGRRDKPIQECLSARPTIHFWKISPSTLANGINFWN